MKASIEATLAHRQANSYKNPGIDPLLKNGGHKTAAWHT